MFCVFLDIYLSSVPRRLAIVMGISDALAAPMQSIGGLAASYAWGPLLTLSRTTVLSLLSRIRVGQLKIVDADGRIIIYGQDEVPLEKEKTIYSVPHVELAVHKDIFWVRMLLFADMVGWLLVTNATNL